jgi:hypothetical protein
MIGGARRKIIIAIPQGQAMVWIIGFLALAIMFTGHAFFIRRLRSRFVAEHPPLPDDAFCEAVFALDPTERLLWVAVRRAVAGQCGVSPESICPEESLEKLWRMTFDGLDELDIMFRLEDELKMRIDLNPFEPTEKQAIRMKSFRDLGSRAVSRLREITVARSTG